MGPPVGSYLENGGPKILDDLYEERVQGKPHSKFEVELRQGNIPVRGSVRSLKLIGHAHLEAILLGYPTTVFQGERRLEILVANHHILDFFLVGMT